MHGAFMDVSLGAAGGYCSDRDIRLLLRGNCDLFFYKIKLFYMIYDLMIV